MVFSLATYAVPKKANRHGVRLSANTSHHTPAVPKKANRHGVRLSANTSHHTPAVPKKANRHGVENIRQILSLPLENRKQALSQYGDQTFGILKSLLVSQKESVPVRWKALTSLARLYPHKSLPLVQRALRSRTWFGQNAGLIAMEIIDPKQALNWAGYFLNAPALVVRTAAVDMIKRHRGWRYKTHLLEKLNAPDSFYKKKSLWIRSHIVSALAVLSEKGEEPLFISFLKDPDERLHIHAILALEKLTGQTFRPSGEGRALLAQAQKHKWIDWWAKTSYSSHIKL